MTESCTTRFAGVGKPLQIGDRPAIGGPQPRQTVHDHARGAGMDLLLAALRVGSEGRAIGVDMTAAMRDIAAASADLGGLGAAVEAGLVDGRIVRRFNCFHGTPAEAKVAKGLFIRSVNFFARKAA